MIPDFLDAKAFALVRMGLPARRTGRAPWAGGHASVAAAAAAELVVRLGCTVPRKPAVAANALVIADTARPTFVRHQRQSSPFRPWAWLGTGGRPGRELRAFQAVQDLLGRLTGQPGFRR